MAGWSCFWERRGQEPRFSLAVAVFSGKHAIFAVPKCKTAASGCCRCFCPLHGGGSGNTREASCSLGHLNKGLFVS